MTKHVEKKLLLLEEYREGFSEIQKLVDGFMDISPETQETFIVERQNILVQQLEFTKEQRNNAVLETRRFLSRINSKLKALKDTESFLISQLEECDEIINKISESQESQEPQDEDKTSSIED